MSITEMSARVKLWSFVGVIVWPDSVTQQSENGAERVDRFICNMCFDFIILLNVLFLLSFVPGRFVML